MRARHRWFAPLLAAGVFAAPTLLAQDEAQKSTEKLSDPTVELQQRVKALETQVKELEQSQAKLLDRLRQAEEKLQAAQEQWQKSTTAVDFLRNRNLFENQLAIPHGTRSAMPNLNAQPVPPNWIPHEFNGMNYYIVPLATNPKAE